MTTHNIQDEDLLYYRVHKTYLVEGKLIPGAFKERGEGEAKGMSTDWSKLSTPQESLNRAKNPSDNGILQGNVGEIRKIGLTVVHAPLPDNPSHANVKGLDTANRRQLLQIFSSWAIEIIK